MIAVLGLPLLLRDRQPTPAPEAAPAAPLDYPAAFAPFSAAISSSE